jgi:hypothetical protein
MHYHQPDPHQDLVVGTGGDPMPLVVQEQETDHSLEVRNRASRSGSAEDVASPSPVSSCEPWTRPFT